MYQGDQYSIPVKVSLNGAVVTPRTATDVRIKIADTLKSYADEEVTYDSTLQKWLYPITEEESRALTGKVGIQVAIATENDNYIYSPIQYIYVQQSIITEEWSDD